jgi:ABC-2 type transport system permease protein
MNKEPISMTITTHPTVAASAPHGSSAVGVLQRSRRDDVASIPTALHSEWIKVSSLRSNRTILALAPVIGFTLTWILATFVKVDPDTDLPFTIGQTSFFSTWLTTILAAILGTLAFTSEVQHGTMAIAVAAQPARWVTVACKTTVAASFGLAMGALGMVGGLSGTIVGGLESGDTSRMASTALWGLVLTTLAPVLGLGVGMILRHGAAAVSILLVWAFVLENIARAFVPVSASRYLPFSLANGMLGIPSASDTPESIAAALTPFQNAVLFGGYALALLAIGTALFSRRDTD